MDGREHHKGNHLVDGRVSEIREKFVQVQMASLFPVATMELVGCVLSFFSSYG
jgi:hypothetical protein